MCGIFGITGPLARETARLEAALDMLRHRGPDGGRLETAPGLAFGHTLLSIIGEEAIRQPLAPAGGRGLLSFNGEIYNYLELLQEDAELRAACRMRPRSDTVVLAEGLRRQGRAFLERLNGMFALAWWDPDRAELLLARDRLGIKPLYWTEVEGPEGRSLVFASEARVVRHLAGRAFEPDLEAFYSWLRFRYPVGARSFDRRVRQLPPGHLLIRDRGGRVRVERWWDGRRAPSFPGDRKEALEEVDRLLRSSVELRMRSDHDFCTYLSGGLDSSLLTALAVRERPAVDSYSIGIAGSEAFDESAFSEAVARHLGTRHHAVLLDAAEFRYEHEALVNGREEPVGVPNQVALKALSRELSREHRVVLSGEGADEVFGGYGRIFLLPHDWQVLNRAREEQDRETLDRVAQAHGRPLPESFEELFLRRYGYLSHEEAAAHLERFLPGQDPEALREAVEGEIRGLYASIEAEGPFNRLLVLFQQLHLPGLLARADAAAMAHSVEARVPFLDHRLVEFMNGLPFAWKVRELVPRVHLMGLLGEDISEVHDVPKSLLKEIAAPLLPREIVLRRKVGFPIPASFYQPEGDAAGVSYRAWTDRNLELLAVAA